LDKERHFSMRIKLHLIFGQDLTNVTKPMQLLANWSSVNNAFCRTGPDLASANFAGNGTKVIPRRG
jgi:hypothetical protein